MPEATARRYRTPLISLFLAALLIAIPLVASCSRQDEEAERRLVLLRQALPGSRWRGRRSSVRGAVRGSTRSCGRWQRRCAGRPDGDWVSIVTEDWIERMSPDSPRSGVPGWTAAAVEAVLELARQRWCRSSGSSCGSLQSLCCWRKHARSRETEYHLGGRQHSEGRHGRGHANSPVPFQRDCPAGTPKTLQGYSVATWEVGRGRWRRRRGGGGGGRGSGSGSTLGKSESRHNKPDAEDICSRAGIRTAKMRCSRRTSLVTRISVQEYFTVRQSSSDAVARRRWARRQSA